MRSMQAVRPLVASLAALALASCGARDGLSVGSPVRTSPIDASTSADVVVPPDAGLTLRGLDGWWMTAQIGDCISAEEWLKYEQPSGFVHTVVDRNYCGPHSVTQIKGTMSLSSAHDVQSTWASPEETQLRLRTTAVLDDAAKLASGSLPDPSYVRGTRALAAGALAQDGIGRFVRRDTWRRTPAQGPVYATDATVSVSLAPAPDAAKAGDACTMSIDVAVQLEINGVAEADTVSIGVACIYRASPSVGWLEIVPKLAPDSAQNAWYDALTGAGVWKKPGHVADAIYASFVPDLLLPPGQPDVVVMPRDLYGEMLSSPPASIK